MFWWIYYRIVTAWNSVQKGLTGAIIAKVRATKSRCNFLQPMHLIHPIGPWTNVSVGFVVFGCIWDRFVTAWNLLQNILNWFNLYKSSCHEVTTGFFATNATNPRHWTLNKCFGPFRSILMHLGLFRNCMKLGAKHKELVQLLQKFVPRSHIRIFRNECTQSAPFAP